ncbi:MAG: transposon-encoded TnpW family protein [bacterium]
MTDKTMKQEHRAGANSFTRKIANTTYTVKVHFSEKATETFDDKMKRVIARDVENKAG